MCDPRDLDTDEEDSKGGKLPRLTIMEEVLLLGLKDKQVRLTLFSLPLPCGTEFRLGVMAVITQVSMYSAPTWCYNHTNLLLVLLRDILHFGMTTFHTLSEDVFS